MSKQMKPFLQRKGEVLSIIQNLARPVWMGDFYPRASEQATIRPLP
jgi:hypothetical protein